MNHFRTALAVVACALSGACYRVTVVTTPAAVGTTDAPTVTKPWNHSFVIGLVPPAPVNLSANCPGGAVTKVVTQRSFLNGLVAGLTYNLYTPLDIKAWCTGGRSSSLGLPAHLLGAPAAQVAAPAPQP